MNVVLVLLPNWTRSTPSLAIAYLASHLIKEGHTVSRYEFNLTFINNNWVNYMRQINNDSNLIKRILNNPLELKKEKYFKLNKYINSCVFSILKQKPEVVGFSIYKDNSNLSLLVARELKKIDKNIKIIFGGPDTFYYDGLAEFFLKTRVVDYVILGEGERLMPELLKKLNNPGNLNIPGVMYLKNNGTIYNENWIPEKDINTFEFPLFQKEDIKNSAMPWRIPIITSRGCTHKCDFCQETIFWKYFRQRSPENVLDEIKFHIRDLGIRYFWINDSLLNANQKFLIDFCNLIIEENLAINWEGNVRASKLLNESMLRLMSKAGCKSLYFGVESGSNDVLRNLNKGTTREVIEQNIKDVHDNNIWVHLYFIVGHPSETEEDFKKTIEFIKKNIDYIDGFDINAFKLLKKSYIYEKKRIHFIDESIANRRLAIMEKIFEHEIYSYKKITKDKGWVYYIRKNRIPTWANLNQKLPPSQI